jgi:hypothetical protein
MQRLSAHVMFEKMNQTTRFLAFEICRSARRLASHKAYWFVLPTTDVRQQKNVDGFIRNIPMSEPYRSVLPLRHDISFYTHTKHSKLHCFCTLKGGNSSVILEYFQVFSHSKRFLSLGLFNSISFMQSIFI